MSNDQEYIIEKVGVFTPKPNDIEELSSGEIGFIITGIKSLSETRLETLFVMQQTQLLIHCQALSLVNLWYFVVYFLLIVLSIKN